MAEKNVCNNCKKDIDEKNSRYQKGMCDKCYAEAWDHGFEASMEYSDKMMRQEKIKQPQYRYKRQGNNKDNHKKTS
ncbi:MAG: hypothetical protein KKE20_03575 [Nanoarchaeota archaeon]|nr:hypothetical protein [Nanoarchaeota archaeon]